MHDRDQKGRGTGNKRGAINFTREIIANNVALVLALFQLVG